MRSLWPWTHLYMAFIMFLFSLVMPLAMIASPSDYFIGPTQIYAAILMASAMLMIEGTMHPMPKWAWFVTIVISIAAVIAIRFQYLVGTTGFLRDMIPHHSMAVLTSQAIERKVPGIVRPEVQDLAKTILETQKTEIEQMKLWIK